VDASGGVAPPGAALLRTRDLTRGDESFRKRQQLADSVMRLQRMAKFRIGVDAITVAPAVPFTRDHER
jgi:hypothetical protein